MVLMCERMLIHWRAISEVREVLMIADDSETTASGIREVPRWQMITLRHRNATANLQHIGDVRYTL